MRILLIIAMLFATGVSGQNAGVKIGLLKYSGGGDWYADPTALPNLIGFCNQNMNTNIFPEPSTIEIGSPEIFNFPFVHLTGHGNIVLSESEALNLRTYLEAGGFLHVDDNYGLDEYFRREIKKVFPNNELKELPPSHSIFNQKYTFNEGIPKIHEHDNKPPQAFGIFIEERLVCLYTYETDLGDGWEDESVHNDPPEVRETALKMGANIISFVFSQ
ncbi:protein of unknown function [Tangfeifania diversioriginum]|uniref:DUF4159 domain-containing protein n=1 Tax=Tangfeifania diversioriginum TaxID=1168035 RepID=A0A1M6CSD5_9BACT|nr:DUF4159 domain-containing protein [Tangfeifania diversioriginum]SHI64005.1 protein of unknown function [Tangfeifania diversioriginum]